MGDQYPLEPDALEMRRLIDEAREAWRSFAAYGGSVVSQVMAPGHPYYEFFGKQAHGPVPLFEVDDVHSARGEFEAAGVDVIGSTEHDSHWEWIHVRAPDGNLYEFASRLPELRTGA